MRCLNILMSSVAVSAALLSSAAVFAQGTADAYPSKPVLMIVSSAPGGPNDQEARLYVPKISAVMGQPFVLDFKTGAGGTIGSAFVAKAVPDGHTILLVTGNFTVTPSFYPDLAFDTVKDFAPVSLMSKRALVLVVNPSFAAKTLAEYLAYAKANPGKINFGTSGAGGINHLLGAWMHSLTNTTATFVHYKGAAPQLLDLLAGRLDATATALNAGLPLIKAGKVRALGVTGDKRSKDLPTIEEQGVPGYSYTNWLGFVAPGATPGAVVNKLSEGFGKVANMADIVAALEADGAEAAGTTPAQFRQVIAAEVPRWRKLVQEAGIKL